MFINIYKYIFCPFNLLAFWNISVLSLNRNNFTITRDRLVLKSPLLCFTRYARSISIPSKPHNHSCHVSPFVSFIPSILRLFWRDLSLNSVSLSWAYFGSIWCPYNFWISFYSFSILFSTLSIFFSAVSHFA